MKQIILFILSFLIIIPCKADTDIEKNKINIYLFYSDECPHCEKEIKFLKRVEQKYSNVEVYKYEIHDNRNREIIKKVENEYKIKLKSIPLTIIGEKYFIGYNEEKSPSKLITTIEYYNKYNYNDNFKDNNENNKENKDINIDKYIKENSNKKIIFNITSDDLDLDTTTMILGIKEAISIINIIILGILSVLIKRIKTYKNKIITTTYIFIFLIITELTRLYNLKMIMNLVIVASILIRLIISIKFKKNQHLPKNIYHIIIVYGLIIIENLFQNSNIEILNEILKLNLTPNINFIFYIVIYIFCFIMINTLILIVLDKIIFKIKLAKNRSIT